jgi:hypothetical protein
VKEFWSSVVSMVFDPGISEPLFGREWRIIEAWYLKNYS